MQWLLDLIVIAVLGATMLMAFRLERTLGALRRDRLALETLMAGFTDSTLSAEQGVARLRAAAEGAGRQIASQTTQASNQSHELAGLVTLAERMTERLERGLRLAATASPSSYAQPSLALPSLAPAALPLVPQTDRWETAAEVALAEPAFADADPAWSEAPSSDPATRPRSKAERDLLAALRSVR